MIACPPGTRLDLGGPEFVFVEAVMKDLPSSQWGYESSQQVLFVSDAFAYSHRPPTEEDDHPTHRQGECSLLASELGVPPGPEQIVWITRAALYWTRFVKMERLLGAFSGLLDVYPARLVAPAHGAVIDDPDAMVWRIWDALSLAYDPYGGVKHAGTGYRERELSS
jgi:hypothetical protein